MLLTDIYYAAGEIEAQAVGRPSWAKPHTPSLATADRRGARHVVGHALIGLGRKIAAEPAARSPQVNLSRSR